MLVFELPIPSVVNASANVLNEQEKDVQLIENKKKEEVSVQSTIPLFLQLLKTNWNKAKQKGKKVKDNHSKTKKKLPVKSEIYSSKDRVNAKGKVVQRRYYDGKGRVRTDIDYTNHGNSKTHPKVPHRHDWKWKNGKPVRGKWY